MHLSAYTVNQFQPHATGQQTQSAVAGVFRQLAPTPQVLGAAADAFVAALQPHLSPDGHAGLAELAGGIARQFAIPSTLTQFAALQAQFGTAIERVEDPDTLAHAPNESLGPRNFFGAARGIAAYAYLVDAQG